MQHGLDAAHDKLVHSFTTSEDVTICHCRPDRWQAVVAALVAVSTSLQLQPQLQHDRVDVPGQPPLEFDRHGEPYHLSTAAQERLMGMLYTDSPPAYLQLVNLAVDTVEEYAAAQHQLQPLPGGAPSRNVITRQLFHHGQQGG